VLELKKPHELAQFAYTLATGQQLVRYHNVTYIPADYETDDVSVPPEPDRTIWHPLTRDQLSELTDAFNILFPTDNAVGSFEFMLAQNARRVKDVVDGLLVRTAEGLKYLDENGKLTEATGVFVPNTLVPVLNEDPDEKARVFGVISGWLNSDGEAESLLSHLATCLSPGWPAVRYVLLLGEGANGKSLLLKMVEALFGMDNVSHVSRQAMSEKEPEVLELSGKLVNVIYDGVASYLRDSAVEKTLIAGEVVNIHELYRSSAVKVRTNALFLEGLNREPKTSDKSLALQRRLVRFHFPNVYPLDQTFEKRMLRTDSLGAFLSLLVDRFVRQEDLAVRLAPTRQSIALQLEAMHSNSLALQFLAYLEETEPLGAAATVVGMDLAELVVRFRDWRHKEMDLSTWSDPDIVAQFNPLVNTERRSKRVNGKPRKVKVVVSLRSEASAYIDTLKGDEDDAAVIAALVDE